MKQKYITPLTELIKPQVESLLETASPGGSSDPYDPDKPIESKENTFDDEDDTVWGDAWE